MTKPVFSKIGGHPAIDFANTRPMRRDGPHELLIEWQDVVAWALQFGLIDSRAPVDGGDAAQVRSLRDAFVRILQADAPAPADVGIINDALGMDPNEQELDVNEDRFVLSRSRSIQTADALVGRLARIIAEFLTSGLADRVKQCAGENCVLWFVDTTRNHSRHWCRMDRCGARAKSAAYYARSKAEGPADRSAGPSNQD